MYCPVATVIVSRKTLRFNKSTSSTIYFYYPTFQNASWSALVAKLWQQPTIFSASLLSLPLFTLVRTTFIRHPMEPGIKAECRIVCKVCPSDLWRKWLTIFDGDRIRRDRRIKSPGVSPALSKKLQTVYNLLPSSNYYHYSGRAWVV